MILSIAFKEFRDAWRDGRFRLGAVIVFALLGVAMLLAWQQVERATEERQAAAALERENWLNQTDKNAHSATHYGVYVFKPVPVLSVFDRGLEPYVGNTFFLEGHRQNQAAFLPAQDATAMRRFGELTAATALQLLAPLLIILLTFGALAGEREKGTLRQVLSLGVRPWKLVLGKGIGLGLVLLSLFVPVAVLGTFVMSKLTEAPEGTDAASMDWGRMAWITGAYSAYLAAILATSLGVSALARTSRSALIILLVFWTVNAVLAPRIATDFAQRLHPTPKLADFETEVQESLKNEGMNAHSPGGSKRQQEFIKKTLEEHGVSHPSRLPFNIQGLFMLESERLGDLVFDRHFGELWDILERQDRVVTWSGLVAPLLGVRSASMALSGTDFTHHRHFSVAAEQHRRTFTQILNKDEMTNMSGGHHGPAKGRELWEQLPEFDYKPPDTALAIRAAQPGLVVLAVWLVLSWGALFAAAQRLKPN